VTPLRGRARPARERGVALVLTLLVLLGVGGLLAAYLAVSTIEPQISRNLAEASRARYLAEAGIERGFTVLIASADAAGGWSGLLAGATTARPWVALDGLTNAVLAGGRFSVMIRNDNGATDTPLTGLSATTRPAMDTSPTVDANTTLIMRASGTSNRATKTIEVVVRRAALPRLAGAVNISAANAQTVFDAGELDLDGRDYACPGGGSVCDTASNWAPTASPLKFGMAVPPGTEAAVEASLGDGPTLDGLKGKSRTDAGAYATGRDTIAGDDTLNPALVDELVRALARNPSTTVLRSAPGCRLVVSGGATEPSRTATVANGCGTAMQVDLGSRQDPRLVFVAGGVTLDRSVKGAGVLVVQDGDLMSQGDLEWDGLVIAAGRATSMRFAGGGRTTIRGGAITSESTADGAAGAGAFAIRGATGRLSIRASQQNVEMAQAMRALHSITNWREI
jgi:Tfp pilus assembly protein PilX